MVQGLRHILMLLACGVVVASGGCSSLPTFKRSAIKQATAANPAVRCLCVWQQAEGPGPSGETTRGMAGQLFFFPREGEIPVAVQGDLKVFVFDDFGSDEEQSRPIHQVDVPSYELSSRLGETQFGPSYSIFVPYTRRTHFEANCAVRVKLTRPDGSALFSEMTQVRLTGTPRTKSKSAAEESQAIALAKAKDDHSEKPISSTIAVERDGKMQLVNQRLRYIGDANSDTELGASSHDDRDERLREYEAKLRALQSGSSSR